MSFAQVLGSLWPGTGTGEDSLATGTASDPVLMSVHLCLFCDFCRSFLCLEGQCSWDLHGRYHVCLDFRYLLALSAFNESLLP